MWHSHSWLCAFDSSSLPTYFLRRARPWPSTAFAGWFMWRRHSQGEGAEGRRERGAVDAVGVYPDAFRRGHLAVILNVVKDLSAAFSSVGALRMVLRRGSAFFGRAWNHRPQGESNSRNSGCETQGNAPFRQRLHKVKNKNCQFCASIL